MSSSSGRRESRNNGRASKIVTAAARRPTARSGAREDTSLSVREIFREPSRTPHLDMGPDAASDEMTRCSPRAPRELRRSLSWRGWSSYSFGMYVQACSTCPPTDQNSLLPPSTDPVGSCQIGQKASVTALRASNARYGISPARTDKKHASAAKGGSPTSQRMPSSSASWSKRRSRDEQAETEVGREAKSERATNRFIENEL